MTWQAAISLLWCSALLSRIVGESAPARPAPLNRLWNGFYNIIRYTDVYVLEVISGCTALWSWGILLMIPSSTFSTSASYSYISWLPEWFWGAFMFVFGTTQLVLVLLALSSYAITRSDLLGLRPIRMTVARFGGFLWGAITILVFLGNPLSTGWGTYLLGYVLGNACVVWRIALQKPR